MEGPTPPSWQPTSNGRGSGRFTASPFFVKELMCVEGNILNGTHRCPRTRVLQDNYVQDKRLLGDLDTLGRLHEPDCVADGLLITATYLLFTLDVRDTGFFHSTGVVKDASVSAWKPNNTTMTITIDSITNTKW